MTLVGVVRRLNQRAWKSCRVIFKTVEVLLINWYWATRLPDYTGYRHRVTVPGSLVLRCMVTGVPGVLSFLEGFKDL